MKTIKKLLILVAITVFATSCLDDTTRMDGIESSPNLAGFEKKTKNAGFVADGNEYEISVPVLITGPNYTNLTEDVTLQFSVDSSSTAVEDVNYSLDVTSLTLTSQNSYSSFLPITIKTQGATAPSTLTLVLNIDSASSDSVLINGRLDQIAININYLCFSDLDNGQPYLNPDCVGGQATVEQVSDGYYLVGDLPFLSSGGNPIPFHMSDNCGNITIDDVIFGAYLVKGEGTVNGDGGFTFTYILYDGTTTNDPVFFDFSNDPSTYTPQ